jgi:hypothetical protein
LEVVEDDGVEGSWFSCENFFFEIGEKEEEKTEDVEEGGGSVVVEGECLKERDDEEVGKEL